MLHLWTTVKIHTESFGEFRPESVGLFIIDAYKRALWLVRSNELNVRGIDGPTLYTEKWVELYDVESLDCIFLYYIKWSRLYCIWRRDDPSSVVINRQMSGIVSSFDEIISALSPCVLKICFEDDWYLIPSVLLIFSSNAFALWGTVNSSEIEQFFSLFRSKMLLWQSWFAHTTAVLLLSKMRIMSLPPHRSSSWWKQFLYGSNWC